MSSDYVNQETLYLKEYEEHLNGYHLVVVFNKWFRCGYVGLPKGHTLENRDYDDFNFDVHGGLTFASKNLKFKDEAHDWYFGFDCAHLNDKADIQTMIKHNASQRDLMVASFFNDGEVRTQEYVLNELRNLVTQIENYKGE